MYLKGDMPTLKEKLESMKERLEEWREIEKTRKRTDLVCPTCKHSPSRACKRTGIVLICKRCYDRKRYLRLKRRRVSTFMNK